MDPEKTGHPRGPMRLYVLKEGDSFVVADGFGNIVGRDDGLFRNDTRVLSCFRLALAGEPPSLLSAAVSEDNVFFTSHMTNQPLPPLGGASTPEGVIHIARSRFLWGKHLLERLAFANYGSTASVLPLSLDFAADFRDMFEVRGQVRPERGRLLAPEIGSRSVLLRYEGLDGVLRTTGISFSLVPERLTGGRAEFVIDLPPTTETELYIEIAALCPPAPSREIFRFAAAKARVAMRRRRRRGARLRTSGRIFNEWVDKSGADLALLTSDLETGPYPYAGIPWFSTPFGRDAIITALQTLWLDPGLTRGVLSFLAKHQAQEVSAFRDAAPGKIMHETRKGEMTARNELPFGQYYGGVDTTPLFVILAGAYADRTGDLEFIKALWPSLQAAMAWIDGPGDSNGDGFLDYARGEATGLANQAWKDSEDSIFHADGSFPVGPVAVLEVQGYSFAARGAMASLAGHLGDAGEAERWSASAEALRAAVEERFWMPDRQFYGIAIDGKGDLCRVWASNVGHLLYCGLPARERADSVAEQLLAPAFNSGWGIRTLADRQARYNPMSYHNGSVWPHDSALAAAGMARHGRRDATVRLLNQTFETAVHFGMRLPELFCGFARRPGEAPIAYPVACLPQAWAAGSVFMMLQACLGIRIDGWSGEIHVHNPTLPDGIDHLHVKGLRVGANTVDLAFHRVGSGVVVFPERNDPPGSVPILTHM
ncbi:MAG TPA: amylo-alpha-1,6-glucosidase [Aestuariivirgaceae bacterium]|nr:amylo-alpha-1,6-glucosidase [Aestuariivirgaceae bacterium]